MKFKFLNNTYQNRQFDYTPRYYDERKSELERKKEMYARQKTGDLTDEEKKQLIKDRMRQSWSGGEYRKTQRRSMNIRVLILIVVLLLLGYFIFNGVDEVDTIVKKLW